MPRLAALVVAAACAASAARAAADACVEIDPERDTLSDQERAAARSLFLQALEANGVAASPAGAQCTAVYRLRNVRLGASVTAGVVGPQGTRTLTVRVLEDLPGAYDQIVRSLLSGAALSTSGSALTRENVTSSQAAPRRAAADSLWYARLGYGLTTGGGSAKAGPGFGFGYRYELDTLGIDLSFLNLAMSETDRRDGSGETDTNVSGSWVRLLAYDYPSSTASSSFYAGAGLSWGGASVQDGPVEYSGSGLQGELSVGYELLRASTIRLFVQADATLPFWRATPDDLPVGLPRDSRYTPTFIVSLGGGFGRRPAYE
jgi:hypothetical protein